MSDTETITSTAVAAPWPTDLKVVFGKPDGAAAIIARVRSEALEQVKGLTVSTKRERDAIASAAYEVAKRKTALDNAGKSLNDELRVSINAVDAERRQIRDSLDALKDEVRAPVTKWEADEEARKDALTARVERLTRAQDTLPENPTAEQIGALLARVEATAIDDTWQEFVATAAGAKDAMVTLLRRLHSEAAKREADAAELAKLRADAEARAEADRQRLKAEQAEAARVAAARAEDERLSRIEREAQERAAKAAAEVEARAKAEAERVSRETAEREAAQIKAAQEAEARHARELADAKAAADRAAQAERDRLAAQAKAEADAQAKREANKRLRAKVRGEIATSFAKLPHPLSTEDIADALMNGQIAHCKVEF